MLRRQMLKAFLGAPAIIRSGVLMPIVPLVVPPPPQSPFKIVRTSATSYKLSWAQPVEVVYQWQVREKKGDWVDIPGAVEQNLCVPHSRVQALFDDLHVGTSLQFRRVASG